MRFGFLLGIILLNCSVFGQVQTTQAPLDATVLRDSGASANRSIRRSIPLTNSIQKAYRAGTRDTSGRPGANYWQLETDFSIDASLNPATQTITGSETITIHNNSPDALDRIVRRALHPDPDLPDGEVFDWPAVPACADEEIGRLLSRGSVDTHVHLGGMLPPAYFWVPLVTGGLRFEAVRGISLPERGHAPWRAHLPRAQCARLRPGGEGALGAA